MQREGGKHIVQDVQVMEATRPLHSISMVCGNECGVVFSKTEGLVIPAGLLDEVLALVRHRVVAKYERNGGRYVAKMRVTDPKAKRPSPANAVPFAGRGAIRQTTGHPMYVFVRPRQPIASALVGSLVRRP